MMYMMHIQDEEIVLKKCKLTGQSYRRASKVHLLSVTS